MASDNFLGMFGSNKRDKEEEQKALFRYFDGNHHKLVENQVKLMAAIKNLSKKIDELQEKLDALQAAPAPAVAVEPDSTQYVDAYAEVRPLIDDYESAPAAVNVAAPASVASPFYANLEGDVFIPISDEMKENALFHIKPQTADTALVEFNALSVPTYISWGPATFENSFECIIDNKDPNSIMPENTTTAHLDGGDWVIDGRIRLRFI